jgi:hypothetical protein
MKWGVRDTRDNVSDQCRDDQSDHNSFVLLYILSVIAIMSNVV